MLNILNLGQSGFRFEFNKTTIYIDPYLSNSLYTNEGSLFERLKSIDLIPSNITDADFLLITHIHQDHCDLDTILPIYKSSPNCKFVGPNEVLKFLNKSGIDKDRLISINEEWLSLNNTISIYPIPAYHPTLEYDDENQIKSFGYIINFEGYIKVYHSGDTFLNVNLIEYVSKFKPIDVAFLPINEHNFMKENYGIIGNMSMKEAFAFAEILNVSKFIPIHWDMFLVNSVTLEEIHSCYNSCNYKFELLINPKLI